MREGYRDRLLTELAQNAADAATKGGVDGTLVVTRRGAQVSFANTGAPLDRAGLEALSALRVSAKTGTSVGKFGVGFTAVRAVSDEIAILSREGSVRFSLEATQAQLRTLGVREPKAGVPVLRLPWPVEQRPAEGFDTEVVLTLRDGVDAAALLDQMKSDATDLLLALPGLTRISIDGKDYVRSTRPRGDLVEVSVGARTWWSVTDGPATWLVPVAGDGHVRPLRRDVLRAPTASDEELTLPAMLVAQVAMQPDRRHVAASAHLDLGHSYALFVAALPVGQRVAMVPKPGFAASAVDGALRESIFAALRHRPWLPAAHRDTKDTTETLVAPADAVLVEGLSDELADLLSDILPGLLAPLVCGRADAEALAAVDVHRFGLARIASELAGVRREPQWWGRLYAALEPLVHDRVAVEELAAIPVPLADGRTVTGPRTVVVLDSTVAEPPTWVRLVHPEAAHPLLARLGAQQMTAADVLADPALGALIDGLDDADDEEALELSHRVLSLATAAGAHLGELPFHGRLLLTDADGELREADQLLLPDAPLAAVLVEESPFGVVEQHWVDQHGPKALRAIGVGWGFTLARDEAPTGPDHHLDDEDTWWSELAAEPDTLAAVRDLELVDPDLWAEALKLLASEPATQALLQDRAGYTCWWLRRHAELHGQPLGTFRHPDDETFAGLLTALDAPPAVLAPAEVESPEFAELLLQQLGDPTCDPTPATIAATHSALGAAVQAGRIDPQDLEPPGRVRALTGAVISHGAAMVLDQPWLAQVVEPGELVVGDPATAGDLAALLDIPLASELVSGEVVSVGRASQWAREPGAVLACLQLGITLPHGAVTVHEQLTVRITDDARSREVQVAWWVTPAGAVHCDKTWARPLGGLRG